MAIDPRLYEKYSGRSGDPYKRLGEALAQGAAQKSRLKEAKDRPIVVGGRFGWWRMFRILRLFR
jgi:hypothetical protein